MYTITRNCTFLKALMDYLILQMNTAVGSDTKAHSIGCCVK